MFEALVDFIKYWWFRYLMVTELYMVEKWEQVTIHVLFAILFCIFGYFNYSILLSLTSSFMGIKSSVDYEEETR